MCQWIMTITALRIEGISEEYLTLFEDGELVEPKLRFLYAPCRADSTFEPLSVAADVRQCRLVTDAQIELDRSTVPTAVCSVHGHL